MQKKLYAAYRVGEVLHESPFEVGFCTVFEPDYTDAAIGVITERGFYRFADVDSIFVLFSKYGDVNNRLTAGAVVFRINISEATLINDGG